MAPGEPPHRRQSPPALEAGGSFGTLSSGTAAPHRKRPALGTDDGSSSTAASEAYLQDEATAAGIGGATKKRKTSAAGSRGVANLTPEQLEKKRANDREAQRAIRERTKAQIDGLQREIQALKSQQPQLELQAALRAKEAVEADLLDIKRRVASFISMMQPLVASIDQLPIYASPSNTYSRPVSQRPSINNASTPSTAGAPSPASVPPPPPGGPWRQQSSEPPANSATASSHLVSDVLSQKQAQAQVRPYDVVKLLEQQRHELVHGLDLGAERFRLGFLLEGKTQPVPRIRNGVNGAQDSPNFSHVPMKHDAPAGAMQFQNQLLNQTQTNPPRDPTCVTLSTPIKNVPPTCILDTILLDFLHERQQRIAEGLSTQEVIGPRYPSVSSLLNPAVSCFAHPVSRIFSDILAKFPAISGLPEQVAILYHMFLLMRWQISPTRENYDRLPDWARPVPSQLSLTHPAWMDHLPWPRMRDKLVRDYHAAVSSSSSSSSSSATAPAPASVSRSSSSASPAPQEPSSGAPREIVQFENMFIPFTTSLSLNWPYEEIDVILQDPDSDELMLNPVFERHVRRLDNWTVGDAYAKAFPELADTYNLKSESEGRTKFAEKFVM